MGFDIATIIAFMTVLTIGPLSWGIILNGLRTTFFSWAALSIWGWRFWIYGGLTWFGVGLVQIWLRT